MAGLSKEQMHELRQLLEQQRKQLQDEIREELLRSDEEHYIDLAERVHDMGEQSVADLLADLNITLVDHQLKVLKEVEDALIRMDMGDYGICIDCGDEIGYERLRAYPAALRCIRCQGLHEKTFAHENNPTL
ncbi:MAG: TraR/DksA family transcriptional regulator [Gammaproteobacteria bacterium]|nr:MAG: TraR/DksA family transcriptional regulator [Gammaproteobacteria bacterium]